jgi:tryptophan 2,3-dioxygenase
MRPSGNDDLRFMPVDATRAVLNAANLAELATVQRVHSRERLPPDFRRRWREHHDAALGVLRACRGASDTRDMASVLCDATCYVASVPDDGRPDYYQYSDLRLFDWYLRSTRDQRRLRQLCLDAVHTLCIDIRDFEIEFQAGHIAGHDVDIDPQQIAERIDVASTLAAELVGRGASPLVDERTHECVESYVRAPDRRGVLTHLTGMPLTRSHDEFMFIRVLQASELCFYAIRVAVTAAVDAVKTQAYARAAEDVEASLTFAWILYRLLFVLRTMPVRHFERFRYNTGAASAIQSVNYQLLDVVLYGLASKKIEYLRRLGHLEPLVRMADARFVSLRDTVRRADGATPASAQFLDVCRQLDRSLLMWRGLHLSFAKTYVPHQGHGTGGTTGASYLRGLLFRGLFNDEEPAWQYVQSAMQDGEGFDAPRLRPGVAIVP